MVLSQANTQPIAEMVNVLYNCNIYVFIDIIKSFFGNRMDAHTRFFENRTDAHKGTNPTIHGHVIFEEAPKGGIT